MAVARGRVWTPARVRRWQARYTFESSTQIRKLHPTIRQEIRAAIESLVQNPLAGHALQFELSGFRSLRVRTWWIIYRINDASRAIEVLYVGARRTIYEQFRDYVLRDQNP